MVSEPIPPPCLYLKKRSTINSIINKDTMKDINSDFSTGAGYQNGK